MKKAIFILMIFICIFPAFSDTIIKTFELIAIVPAVTPEYELDLVEVHNGKAYRVSAYEYHMVKERGRENLEATFSVKQVNESKWKGIASVLITTTDAKITNTRLLSENIVAEVSSTSILFSIMHNGKSRYPHIVATLTTETSAKDSYITLSYIAP